MTNTGDITGRKSAEEQIRFQARLLDAVGQATIATNPQGRIIYWNRAAEELYGWSKEEVMGRPIVEVTLSEEMLERAEEIMSELRAGGAGQESSWCSVRTAAPSLQLLPTLLCTMNRETWKSSSAFPRILPKSRRWRSFVIVRNASGSWQRMPKISSTVTVSSPPLASST